jgi:hypothetical protein
MTNASEQKTNSDMTNKATVSKMALGKDIRAKWDKFSEIEVGALKSQDDLANQLVTKYSLDKAKASAEGKTLVAGRQF